jgi:hypothetical protein
MKSDEHLENFKVILVRWNIYNLYICVLKLYGGLLNYRRISLRYNLSRKCRKYVKFVSIAHSERNIWNGLTVATAISREKRKPVVDGNGCLTDRA